MCGGGGGWWWWVVVGGGGWWWWWWWWCWAARRSRGRARWPPSERGGRAGAMQQRPRSGGLRACGAGGVATTRARSRRGARVGGVWEERGRRGGGFAPSRLIGGVAFSVDVPSGKTGREGVRGAGGRSRAGGLRPVGWEGLGGRWGRTAVRDGAALDRVGGGVLGVARHKERRAQRGERGAGHRGRGHLRGGDGDHVISSGVQLACSREAAERDGRGAHVVTRPAVDCQ